jgi:hypothetical protein
MPEDRGIRRPAVSTAAVIGACLCIFVGAPAAVAATLTLPSDAGAPPGMSAVVLLAIDDAAGLLGTDLVVTYDPAVITAIDVSTTALSSPHTVIDNLSPAGTIRIALYGAQPLSGSGALLAITFTASGLPGSRTSIDLVSADLNEGSIPASLVNGWFCVDGTAAEIAGLAAALDPGSATALLSWTGDPFADSYNLYRATASDLADIDCLQSAIQATSASDDGLAPPSGGLFLYIVTGNTCSGETSAGTDSGGVERVISVPCL